LNSLIIVVIGIILLYLAYIFYGTKISKLLDISDDNETPAVSMNDGVDYVPTQPEVVFGHHFSSIAGAGPIIGPVVAAALFGWLPAFLWIVIGSIFIGGVHDMSSLIASMRHEGKSIASVAGKVMSKRAQLIFAAFIWLTLILIVAVFAVVAAQALINKPEIVLPTLMLIPIALLVGVMGFKFRIDTRISTALGLLLLFAFIYLGLSHPIELPVVDPFKYWVAILLVYAFIASVLPVWTLLQPRDYLASFVLFIGLGLGIIGLAIVRPVYTMPIYPCTRYAVTMRMVPLITPPPRTIVITLNLILLYRLLIWIHLVPTTLITALLMKKILPIPSPTIMPSSWDLMNTLHLIT
jgi:carbon starvation protein